MNRVFSLIAAALLACGLLTMGIGKEVPIGQVEGRVTMKENGRPLGHALVVITPEQSLDEYDWTARNWHVRTSSDGSFAIRSLPAGDYRMEVVARHHSLKDDTFTVTEGQPDYEQIELKPGDHELSLYASQHVLPPHQAVEVQATGFVEKPDIRVELRRLSESAVIKNGGIASVVEGIGYDQDNLDENHLSKFSERIWSDSQPIKSEDLEGSFEQKLNLPPMDEGLYLAVCRAGDMAKAVFLNVSNIALVSKKDGDRVHCFVTDIDSGRPVPGAQLLLARNGHFEPVGKTGADGLGEVPKEGADGKGLVMARSGGSFGICGFQDAEADGESDDSDSATDPNTRIFTYTDRPVYRPGDTIQFKAVIRHLKGDDLRLPGPGEAKVEITDPDQSLLQSQNLSISSHGTIRGSFATSPEDAPGVYQILVHAKGGVDTFYANVAAYRKPDYNIKVTSDKKRYDLGDTASATVDVQYFFGGPVAGAKVTASIYRSPDWSSLGSDTDDEDDTADTDAQESDDSTFNGGEFVQEVKAVTDGTGHATISFPTAAGSNKDDEFDYDYSIQVAVDDEDGHSFEGSGSVLVTRGDIGISASTDPYIVSPGDKADLILRTFDVDDSSKPAPDRPVDITIRSETWTHYTLVEEPIQTLTVRTGSDGSVVVPLRIGRPQDLTFKVSTKDDRGHTISGQTYLSVEGADYYPDENAKGLKAKVDRKTYRVGDTLKALIQSGSPGGTALLTVEADSIKLTKLVPLKSGATIVKFRLDKSMAPNAFLDVAYVRGRKFWETSRSIRVSRPDRRLTVSVVPSVPKALPGSTVGFTVLTKDERGRGVPADVSLGVVDESIYTIKRDTTDIVKGLYPMRTDNVETAYSFPEIYLDGGDKAGGSVPVRRKFLDTADWKPSVETDGSGRARVTVKLPDNLTSWRATAVAATDDSRAGMATANVRVSKPLMVRIEPPQFMVATDDQRIAVAVTNDSGRDEDVTLALRATGLSLGDSSESHLHLDDGQTSSIDLNVSAPASGTGDLIATATTNHGFSDAMEAHFPIVPHGRLVVEKQTGTIGPDTSVGFQTLPNRDPNTGSMVLTVTPSVMSSMLQSLDQLVQFPYGCVEQTMSRFLPAVTVMHALKGTAIHRPDLERLAAKIAVDGFARLKKMQHGDGGWGWWSYDDTDPFMTAWVLDGLKRSEAAGYPPPPNLSTDQAVDWGVKRLAQPFKNDDLDARLYLAYAVAEYGHPNEAKAALRGSKLADAALGELALAALAAQECGDAEIRDASMTRLTAMLSESAPRQRFDHWYWDTDEELALALLAIEKIQPDSPLTETVARDLLKGRSDYGWSSTRGTSLAVAALCDLIERHPETTQPSTIDVSINGTPLQTVTVDPADPDSKSLRVEVPIGRLATGTNRLELKGSGGQPYYSFELRQYDVEAELPRIVTDRDVSVSRSYYRLEPHSMPDGTQKLLESDKPIASARSGDIVRCVITVTAKRPMEFLMVEDPIPSNFRVTDREDPGDGEDWSYWWSSLVIRDDRVSLFARYMPKGVHKLSYVMRAEGIGKSCALPTRAEDMYQPEQYATGGGQALEVTP